MEDPLVQLVDAWRQIAFDTRPYVLPEDQEFLKREKLPIQTDHMGVSIHSGTDVGTTTLHLELRPIPFMGDLTNASIYLLMINPGYRDPRSPSEVSEFDVEKQRQDWREARASNLNQDSLMKYPFLCLDPRFEALPGYKYWYNRLRWLIDAIEHKGASRDEALARTANLFCVLELVPYFTRRTPSRLLSANRDRLPSTNLMLDFVRQRLRDRARSDNALIVVGRKHGLWELPPEEKNILRDAVVPRSGYFRREAPRKRILDWLGRKGLL